MYHPRTVTHIAARVVVLLALVGGGSAAAVTAAGAAAAGGPFASAPVSYRCSLSGYGQGGSPLRLTATVNARSTVTAGSALTIRVVTARAALPPAVTGGMPAISDIGASGTSRVTGGSVSLTGQSPRLGIAADALTRIPSITASGSVIPQAPGTARVYAPRSLLLLPASGSGKLAPVTCTATSVASVRVTVTPGGGSAPAGGAAVTAAGAQAYRCTVFLSTGFLSTGSPGTGSPGTGSGRTGTAPATTVSSSEVMMRLGHSGPGAVGVPENVFLTSANGGFGGSLRSAAAPMASSASLGLAGAYRGSVPLRLVPRSMRAGHVVLAGRWMPRMAGMFRLRAPHRFSLRLRTVQAATLVVVCTALSTTTTTTAVRVTASTAASRAAEQGFAASQGSAAAPGKAPNTGAGGSLHASSGMTLAGGAAALVAGAGIIALALRRRRGHAAI